jgi:N-acetylneuraminic acid mutarotase
VGAYLLASGRVSLAALLLLPALARAVPWSTRAPLGVARQEVAVAELGGLVYVIGGFDGSGTIVDTVEAYDPVGDSWSSVAPVPVPIHHTTATAANGKLYVIGGWSDFFATALASVYEYDPLANSWSPPKTPMPTARGSPAAARVGGLIYVAGGWNAGLVNDFAAYDPVADSWTPLPPMPTGRNHLGAAALAGRFYAVGGRTDLGAGLNNVTAVEVYDPGGGWSGVAPLPRARGGLAVAAASGRLYALGGEGNDEVPSGVFPDVDAYDPAANRWTRRPPMPTPRHGIGAAVLGGLVHVPGGGPVEGFGVSPVHEVFDPASGPFVPALPLAFAVLLGLAIALGAYPISGSPDR